MIQHTDSQLDPVALTRELLHFDTRNPPGYEKDCADYLGRLLEQAGFQVGWHAFAPGRDSLVARTAGAAGKSALCLTGHLDVVPLGQAAWRYDPFAGQIDGNRLYGRGSTDMKAGVAAMAVAAIRAAQATDHKVPLELVFTASEETGCEGAHYLVGLENALSRPGAMLIGEPTSNYPLVAHKGAFWLQAHTHGVTAHGSMPEKGDNAIYKAARAALTLEAFRFSDSPDPILGAPTLNTGTIEGGLNMNSVPDRATLGIDIRTLPGQDHDALLAELKAQLGDQVELEVLHSTAGIATPASDDWVQSVYDIMAKYLDQRPEERGATYYTDGSIFKPALGDPPTLVLGPGDPALAHKTDEYCDIQNIRDITEAYTEICRDWLERPAPPQA
jgi:succinyl-diaminopimelate desuccinylase